MLRFLFTACAALLFAASSTSASLCTNDIQCAQHAAGLPTNYAPTVQHVPVPQQAEHSFTTYQSSAASAKGDKLRFRQLVSAAPWAGRAMAQLHSVNRTVTFRDPVTNQLQYYRSPLVLFGGWIPGQFTGRQNDVWASSDGVNWKIIAGHTLDGQSAAADSADSSFRDEYNAGVASTIDPKTQNIYMMGGLTNQFQNDVWMSSNGGVTWRNQAETSRVQHTAGFYPALAATSQGVLIEATGGNVSNFGNDVYASYDQGKNWRVQNPAAKFFARYAQISFSTPNPVGYSVDPYGAPTSATDFMYVIAGQASHDNLNDVWATSDEGRTWAVISAAGPFPQRHLASGAATKDGLLIIAAGFADEVAGAAPSNRNTIQNDVWVSANGGYTWGRCTPDAEWDDRYLPMVALDQNGFLIVGSGVQWENGQFQNVFNDVWRSTLSFHDLAAVSTACGVDIPACGVGLRCWPGNDTVVATDGSFVACGACPNQALFLVTPPADASSVTSIVMWVFILLSVVLVGVLAWLYQKAMASGVSLFGGKAANAPASAISEDKLLGTAETSEAPKSEL